MGFMYAEIFRDCHLFLHSTLLQPQLTQQRVYHCNSLYVMTKLRGAGNRNNNVEIASGKIFLNVATR